MIGSVHLIGLGGTGSALAEPLARLLRYHPNAGKDTELFLWDGDQFTESNEARQLRASPGMNKANVHGLILGDLFVRTTSLPRYITPDDWSSLAIGATDIVILAVDNDRTRHDALMAFRCRHLDGPPRKPSLIVLPGNDDHIGSLVAADSLHIDELLADHEELVEPKDDRPHDGSCMERAASGMPQTITANFTAAALALWAVTNWLDTDGDASAEHPGVLKLSFNFRRWEVERVG